MSLKFYNAALAYEDRTSWPSEVGEAAMKLHHHALAYRYFERAYASKPSMVSWNTEMQLMHALCASDYDRDKFELLKQDAASYAQIPPMNYPRSHSDRTYYQAELPWGDETVPNLSTIEP